MEDSGKNRALFHRIRYSPTPHRYRMGKYMVHLPALSSQVRVYIALQGDVGAGVSQQLAKGLYIAPRLQTGRCKGVAQRVRAYLPDGRLLQIRFDAFPVAMGFGGLGLAAGQEPCSIAGASAQLFQQNKQLLWKWNFSAGGAGFGGGGWMTTFVWPFPQEILQTVRLMFSVPNFRSKSPHCRPQISPIRSPNSSPSSKPILRGVGFACTY